MHRLFLDDSEYQSFARRLAWSPDGTFLLTPGSWYQDLQNLNSSPSLQYTVYGFLKTQINKPAFMLPGIKNHATCIRFCPYLFKLKNSDQGILNLPYRILFAVGTIDHLLIYSTESTMPVAIVKNIHLDSINDIAWMGDSLIIVASSDGFCSFIQLQRDLVGERLQFDSPLMPEKLKEFY